MKFDSLSSSTALHGHEARARTRGGAEPKVRRVGEAPSSSPDRDPSLRPPLGQIRAPQIMASDLAARWAREVAARILRLGSQASRLIRKEGVRRYPPVDEEA